VYRIFAERNGGDESCRVCCWDAVMLLFGCGEERKEEREEREEEEDQVEVE